MAIFQSIPIEYLQKSCSRIANIPFGGSTRPVICRSGGPKSLIDPIEPPTIAQECCAITQIRRNVRLERFSEPPTRETDVRYASESIFPILAGLAAGPILQYIVQYLQEGKGGNTQYPYLEGGKTIFLESLNYACMYAESRTCTSGAYPGKRCKRH